MLRTQSKDTNLSEVKLSANDATNFDTRSKGEVRGRSAALRVQPKVILNVLCQRQHCFPVIKAKVIDAFN